MSKKICNKCNTENPEEAIFCRHCGKRFGNKPLDESGRKGYLSIQSIPTGAPLWIDKKASGKTPAKVLLDEGTHRVYVGNYKGSDCIQTVYVRRGETSFVKVQLADKSSDVIQSSGKIFNSSKFSYSGIIQVQCSQRNVVVKIDDHYIGIAPLKTSVKEGLHKVHLSAGLLSKTYSVNVRRGEIAYVNGKLLGNTKVSSTPSVSNKSTSTGCLRHFWITVIAVICAIVIGWWLYSYYFGRPIPFFESHVCRHTLDSFYAASRLTHEYA